MSPHIYKDSPHQYCPRSQSTITYRDWRIDSHHVAFFYQQFASLVAQLANLVLGYGSTCAKLRDRSRYCERQRVMWRVDLCTYRGRCRRYSCWQLYLSPQGQTYAKFRRGPSVVQSAANGKLVNETRGRAEGRVQRAPSEQTTGG